LGYHVHFKDGKFAVWSTIVDAYVTDWCDQLAIFNFFRDRAVERAIVGARDKIMRAKEQGCSALLPARHSREEI